MSGRKEPFETNCERCGVSIMALRITKTLFANCIKENNRKLTREGQRKRRAENPEYQKGVNQRFYAKHKKEQKQRTKDYAKANPEKRREWDRQWRLNNPERWKEHCRNNYLRNKLPNKEEENAKARARYYKNYEQYRALGRRSVINYRARSANAEGTWTEEEFQEICSNQEWLCFYCGEFMEKATVDHMIPLSRGGSNWPDNLAAACGHCNYSKADKTPEEYFEWLIIRKQGA